MRWWFPVAIVVFGGCDLFGSGGTDPTDVDPLDDPPEYDPACDGYEGTPIPGAMGWFVGQFDLLPGDQVEGTEVWALIANDAWVETGEGWDCQMVWNMAGIVSDPVNCVSCDYALQLDGTPNPDASDCHPRFYQAEGVPFSVTYNVRVLSDGTAEFLFAESGNVLGAGEERGDSVGYETDPRCFYF